MAIQITRRDGSVLFTAPSDASDLRAAVVAAARAKADLGGANLHGANLYGADLHGADPLYGADLIDCGHDSRGYRWVAVRHDDSPRIAAGCRWYMLAEAHAHWDGEHASGEAVGAECRARLALIEQIAAVRWPELAARPTPVEVP